MKAWLCCVAELARRRPSLLSLVSSIIHEAVNQRRTSCSRVLHDGIRFRTWYVVLQYVIDYVLYLQYIAS